MKHNNYFKGSLIKWLIKLRIGTLMLLIVAISPDLSWGQTLTLKELYQAADEVNPVIQQKLYHQTINDLKEQNASLSNRPKLLISGQFTYQSDVFTLPFSNPAAELPEIPKDQFQITLGLQQKIYDGGSARLSKALSQAELESKQQSVMVELYQIRDVINQLFFSSLIIQENIKITETIRKTLENQLVEIESGVKNGVLLPSNSLILKKEIISLDQKLISLKMDFLTLQRMLSAWVGRDISPVTQLQIPKVTVETSTDINRPELALFDFRSSQIEANQNILSIKNHPKVFAFFNGGLGRPNPFDFFETDPSGFYQAGIKIQWNIFDWNQNNNEIKALDLQKNILATQKTDFERKILISIIKDDLEIEKLEALIEKDGEILAIQKEIVKESYSQLQNGVITSTAYITEVNNQSKVEIMAKINQLNLIRTKINKLNKAGNL